MRYFIQLAANEVKFECVDKHVFDNRKFAITKDGTPRYTDNWFSLDGHNVEIHCENIPTGMIAGIGRMLGNSINATGLGTFDEPDSIEFRKGRSEYLYKCGDQTKWKRAA